MTCAHCNANFTPKRRGTRFCRPACRCAAFRDRNGIGLKESTLAQLNAQRRARGLGPLRANDALSTLAQLLLAIKDRYRYSRYVDGPKGKPLASEQLLDPAATEAGISFGRIGGQLLIAVVVAAEEARPAPPAPTTAEEVRPAPPTAGPDGAAAPPPAPAPVLDATGRAP